MKLSQYDNTTDFNKEVHKLEFLNGGTNIGKALTVALEQLFTIPNGMRANVSNVLILLTDGVGQDPEVVTTAVRRIRARDIKLVAVGIGTNVNEEKLLKLVNASKHLYRPKTFQKLLDEQFIKDIVGEACPIIGKR